MKYNRGLFSVLVYLGILLPCVTARAQTASPAIPVFRPGRYVSLHIETDAAGPVRISGNGVQSIEWPAPGRGSAVVPLLIYGDTENVAITVSGKPARLDVHALGPADADPPELNDFWENIDPLPPAPGPVFDDDAYQQAAMWRPGRGPLVRRFVLVATLVCVLLLGAAVHVDPKRPLRWAVGTGVALGVGILVLMPTESLRRVLPTDGRPRWEWEWLRADESGTIRVDWTPGLRFVPRSVEQLHHTNPTLQCDAAGRPVGITVTLIADDRAVFIRPRGRPPASAE